MTTSSTAQAFVAGRRASSHNSTTDGTTYQLHGHAIAQREPSGAILFDWCGWHTSTTARHMNAILQAAQHYGRRVSYAAARDGETAERFRLMPDGEIVPEPSSAR